MKVYQCLLAFVLCTASVGSLQGDTVRYELTFGVTWSPDTHPDAFPPRAHFSSLVGLTHNEDYALWEPGELASPGTQQIAETGGISKARDEMAAAIGAGTGHAQFQLGSLSNLPRSRSGTFEATLDHAYVSFASMIAPSPDWFVGGSAVPLRQDGHWIPEITLDMVQWDAGTDSGVDFTSANLRTSPHVPIFSIAEETFSNVPLGEFTLRLVSLPGDFNTDGVLGAEDIDLLCGQFGEASDALDLTGDSLVDQADLRYWVEELRQTRLGDADLNGDVSFEDFLALSEGFGEEGDWTSGDFDCSGDTDFADFLQLATSFGFPEAEQGANLAAVPEPASGVMMLFGLLYLGLHRRQRGARN